MNLDQGNTTLFDFLSNFAKGKTHDEEIILMVASQMFELPIGVITPNYIWCTHDIDVPSMPVVLLLDKNGNWSGTCKIFKIKSSI